MANIRMYLGFSRLSFNRKAAYRFDVWTQVFANVLFLFMWMFIWQGLYSGKETVLNVTFHSMLSYVLVSQMLQGLHSAGTPLWEIQEQVRTGNIAMEMVRPYDYPTRLLFSDFGGVVFYFLTAILPLYIVLLVIFQPATPTTASQWLIFFISSLLGYIIRYNLELTFGLFTFWLIETGGVEDIFYFSIALFSGSVVPLWFFPPWLEKIASFLPFQGIYFIPNSIFVGNLTGPATISALVLQLCWVGITYLLMRYVWRKASTKIVVQGG
jgi:ABC-2 type transport system permease protein